MLYELCIKTIHLLRYITTKSEVRESFEDTLERDSVLALSLARGFQKEVFFSFKTFFHVDGFQSLYWICYNFTSMGFFGHKACRISAPWPGFESTTPALEGKVLTTGPLGKSPKRSFDIAHPKPGSYPQKGNQECWRLDKKKKGTLI